MYNNEITYDKKWDTKYNQECVNRISKKYKTYCWSSVPSSWAIEVEDLLDEIDSRWGIGRLGYTWWEKCMAKIHNFIFRPIVFLEQYKEKYGTLRIYFFVRMEEENDISEEIEDMIARTEVLLSLKGAYFTFESMREWYEETFKEEGTKKYRHRKWIEFYENRKE